MKYVLLLGIFSVLPAFAAEGNDRPCLTGSVVCPKESQNSDPYAWPAPPGSDPRCVVTPEIIAIRRTNNPAQIQMYDSYLTAAGCPGMFKPPAPPAGTGRFDSIPEPAKTDPVGAVTSSNGDPTGGDTAAIEHHDDKPRP